jgi:hypothetical protein
VLWTVLRGALLALLRIRSPPSRLLLPCASRIVSVRKIQGAPGAALPVETTPPEMRPG